MMVGIACDFLVENEGINTLSVIEIKVKLELGESKKIEAINLGDIKYHFLPQYGPISCFGINIDS